MNTPQPRTTLAILRWTVGLVVLWEAYRFAFSAAAVHHLQHMRLPRWLPPILGGLEMLAAILFLIPKVDLIGAYFLLAIFTIAAAIHVLHGEFAIGTLLVYAAAVLTCMPTTSTSLSGELRDGR